MVKYRVVVNEGYARTFQENGGDYTMTAYYTLNADDNLDAMDGTTIVVQATVRDMLVDEKGKCSVTATIEIRDLATNDVIADGNLDLINESEDNGDWEVSSSNINPSAAGSLQNVSTGEQTVTIASAGVTSPSPVMIAKAGVLSVDVEINEVAPTLEGEVIKRGISSENGRIVLTTVVDALQSVDLVASTVETYIANPLTLSGSYYNLRSSDAGTVVYGSTLVEATGVGDAAHNFPMVEVTDTEYHYAQEFGTKAGARSFRFRSGDEQWDGLAILPIPAAEAQNSLQFILRDTNGKTEGIAITQLRRPAFGMKAPVVTVSRSTVSAALADATAADLLSSLTIQQLTKKNLNA